MWLKPSGIAVCALAWFILGQTAQAQEPLPPSPPTAAAVVSFEQQPPTPPPAQGAETGEPGADPASLDQLLFGYPPEPFIFGTPTDVEYEINNSFPQPSALFPYARLPGTRQYLAMKKKLYDDYGLKLGFSYQQLYQLTTATVPTARFDRAWGQWASIDVQWTLFNKGKDFEGSVVGKFGLRDPFLNNYAVPAQFGGLDTGSIWSNYEFTFWGGGFRVEDLFWEQWLTKDRFVVRVGNQIAPSTYNFFRFKDARTAFTASPFAFHETIPYPTYGFATSFKWWPVEKEELYVVGTVNDMNGDPNALGLNWNTVDRGEFFYGLEIGNFWRRKNGEFDHLHLDLFAASTRSTRFPDTTPNRAGGGFKILGEKQNGQYVGFASYTYNTAAGGGISATFAGHTGTAGLAYLRPFNVNGELALGYAWSQSLPNILPGVGRETQHGIEAYWRLLITPNMWITPGAQIIFNPILNPSHNFLFVPHIKASIQF